MKKILLTASFLFFSIFLYAGGIVENDIPEILPEFLNRTETFQELGYTTDSSVASFLKISVADFKTVTGDAPISEIIVQTPKTIGETVITMAIACELILSIEASIEQKTVNEILNTLRTGNANDKQTYTNIMLTRRILRAWGVPPYYSEPEQESGTVSWGK